MTANCVWDKRADQMPHHPKQRNSAASPSNRPANPLHALRMRSNDQPVQPRYYLTIEYRSMPMERFSRCLISPMDRSSRAQVGVHRHLWGPSQTPPCENPQDSVANETRPYYSHLPSHGSSARTAQLCFADSNGRQQCLSNPGSSKNRNPVDSAIWAPPTIDKIISARRWCEVIVIGFSADFESIDCRH